MNIVVIVEYIFLHVSMSYMLLFLNGYESYYSMLLFYFSFIFVSYSISGLSKQLLLFFYSVFWFYYIRRLIMFSVWFFVFSFVFQLLYTCILIILISKNNRMAGSLSHFWGWLVLYPGMTTVITFYNFKILWLTFSFHKNKRLEKHSQILLNITLWNLVGKT